MNQFADQQDQVEQAAESVTMAFRYLNTAENIHAKNFIECIKWGFNNLTEIEMADYLQDISNKIKSNAQN